MLKKYEAPELEVIRFSSEDVITTSTPDVPVEGGVEGGDNFG